MKRNAVAVAVGALFIAPAAQAQIVFGNDTIGTVQFYGKLYPKVISAKSSGATETGASVSTLASSPTGTTAGSRLAVDSQNSSRLPAVVPVGDDASVDTDAPVSEIGRA